MKPRRPARRASGSSAATSVLTAARWSGSVAWRSPSRIAASATTRKTSPAPRAAMWWSRPNIELLLTRWAEPCQGEVVEAGLVADGLAHRGAHLAQHVAGDRLAAPPSLAGDVIVVAGRGRAQARADAEVHVAHEPQVRAPPEVARHPREVP